MTFILLPHEGLGAPVDLKAIGAGLLQLLGVQNHVREAARRESRVLPTSALADIKLRAYAVPGAATSSG